jgi:hypothetical protein
VSAALLRQVPTLPFSPSATGGSRGARALTPFTRAPRWGR